ncbi:hypothetical protein [Azotosporobacter soli]|uniref:hypothetical protein n=1 Tax=Azotosporobacter soli TaxID=3055040 RepID=UPI0031FF0E6C
MIWKKWVLWFGAFYIGLMMFLVAGAEVLLWNLNEDLDIKHSIEEQLSKNGLYGRVLIGQNALYKWEMARKQKPKTMAVGSSRVMQFRKEFFTDEAKFYNAGGCMSNLDMGREFLFSMKDNQPERVILGIDFWWLNDNYTYNDSLGIRRELIKGDVVSNFISNRFYLYGSLAKSLLNGTITRGGVDLFRLSNYHRISDPYEGRVAIGLSAAVHGDGFREDGSYQYGGVIRNRKNIDEDFADTLKQIKECESIFAASEQVNSERLNQLKRLISEMKQSNIDVVVVIPPLSNKIYSEIKTSPKHDGFYKSFQTALLEMCAEENISFYDFSDITAYGSNDKETIDGIHGSETCYAKLSVALSQDHVIGRYIDEKKLREFIATSNSRTCVYKE